MAHNDYDPKQVVISWNGIVIDGFADGTYISVERNEDMFALTVGADGETTRTKTNNRSGRITVTLMQTSSANALLAAAHNLDDQTGVNNGPFLMEDLLSGTIIFGANTWITKMPVVEKGKEASNREWVFESADLQEQLNLTSA